MAVGGKLIQLAGTGPNDADWVADPEWIKMADEMTAAGMDALNAAKARNVAMLNTAGDRLVAACEACHKKFKPGLTSMGIYKSPNYPPKN
jgi:cytochrome c556